MSSCSIYSERRQVIKKSERRKRVGNARLVILSVVIPSRTFGSAKKVNRSFQSSWCRRFSWIHYDNARDLVLCFSCCKAAKEGKVRLTVSEEKSFVVRGLCNWKDATRW